VNAELEGRTSELKRVDSYHLNLLNSVDQSMFVTDRTLVVTSWNQASERMWGLRAEQVVGRHLAALPLGDMIRVLRPALDNALRRETAIEVPDVPYTLSGGEVRGAVVKVIPLRDAERAVIGVVALAVPGGAAPASR
jgi:two-component system CheB/CheR fusion protein